MKSEYWFYTQSFSNIVFPVAILMIDLDLSSYSVFWFALKGISTDFTHQHCVVTVLHFFPVTLNIDVSDVPTHEIPWNLVNICCP